MSAKIGFLWKNPGIKYPSQKGKKKEKKKKKTLGQISPWIPISSLCKDNNMLRR